MAKKVVFEDREIGNISMHKSAELSSGGFLFFYQRNDMGEGVDKRSFLLLPDEVEKLRQLFKEEEK